ncbi:MAG: hypothetical protein RIC50_17220 [Rhodospirillales bacterium]
MAEDMPDAQSVTTSMGYLEYKLLPVETGLMPQKMPEFLAYWDRQWGDRWAPAWSEFKLFDLPPQMIPMTVVVDVDGQDPEAARFVYRFWGTRRAELYGKETMGQEVRDALPDKSGPIVAEQLGLTLKARKPVLFRNVYPFKPAENATCITLRLPITSPDGLHVEKIVSLAVIVDNPEAFVDYVTAPGGFTEKGG